MPDAKIKAARLTPNMVDLLTDLATHPQMYITRFSRWDRTAQGLTSRGLAFVPPRWYEGHQYELRITDAGRDEAARRGIIPGRRQCRGCARSGGELTENGCPSCGPGAEIGIVASAPYSSEGTSS